MRKFKYENLGANYDNYTKLGDFWKPPENEKPVVKKWGKNRVKNRVKKKLPDLIPETKKLAQISGVELKDCGNGHLQLRGNGNLVNYYPNSKNRSIYSPTLNRKERHISPCDAVRLCLRGTKVGKRLIKKKDAPKTVFKPCRTNPSGLTHFYSGDEVPWDVSESNTTADEYAELEIVNEARNWI